MNASVISALAALAGTAVGGLTSVLANWLSHRIRVRAQWRQHEKNRRQILYRDFIEEAGELQNVALRRKRGYPPRRGARPGGMGHAPVRSFSSLSGRRSVIATISRDRSRAWTQLVRVAVVNAQRTCAEGNYL